MVELSDGVGDISREPPSVVGIRYVFARNCKSAQSHRMT